MVEHTVQLETRAMLLADPYLELAPGVKLPVRPSRSTAGPPPGKRGAVFLRWEGQLVRVNVTTGAEFKLELIDKDNPKGRVGHYRLTRDGSPFIENLELVEPLLHAPDMAFINLYSGCDLNCAFCTQPTNAEARVRPIPEMVTMVKEAEASGTLRSISLTSGIWASPTATTQALVWSLMALREAFPDLPLGVEHYLDEPSGVARLKAAGADEIKLNLQVATPDLLARVCPEMVWETLWANLAAAVEVFGRGRVQSNLLVGLGESRDELTDTLGRLAGLGVLPTIRPLRLTAGRRVPLELVLGHTLPRLTPAYLLDLLDIQTNLLIEHDLPGPAGFPATMCQACGACDLGPPQEGRGIGAAQQNTSL